MPRQSNISRFILMTSLSLEAQKVFFFTLPALKLTYAAFLCGAYARLPAYSLKSKSQFLRNGTVFSAT